MNRCVLIGLVTVVVFGSATTSRAQTQSPLVGAWERVSAINMERIAEGEIVQPPSPVSFLMFSADGFFSQIGIPTGRPKVSKPLDQMTKEELLQRFNRLGARRGTYTVTGNRLSRKLVTNTNPNQDGIEQLQLFRIEGGILVLSSADPKLKNGLPGVTVPQGEYRFRRAK